MGNGKKITRELGLVLAHRDDVIEAIFRLTNRTALYQRKLDTYENRKEFTRTNMKYELQRSQFYRYLGSVEKAPIEVEEIKSF